MKSKEMIYDEEIAPLMNEILKVCQANKIAMLAQFATPSESDADLVCTSALVKTEYKPSREMIKAFYVLHGTNQGE